MRARNASSSRSWRPAALVIFAACAATGCLRATDDTEPLPELCNRLDDDSDGVIDEAGCVGATADCAAADCALVCLPGRGDADGTYSTGCECELAGDGHEACNGEDDDCDGDVDEGWTGGPAERRAGVCAEARLRCVNGQPVEPNYGEIVGYEQPELTCDGRDNDCDGQVDETYVEVCNGVDDDCDAEIDEDACAQADALCVGGDCRLVCHGGWGDGDGLYHNGCECPVRHDGVERCNGLDDDCDGPIDEEAVGAPLARLQFGVCAGATKVCQGGGWGEPPYAEIAGYQEPERDCDGSDNDCDGGVDEAWPDVNTACAAGVGRCRVEGRMRCDPSDPRQPPTCDARSDEDRRRPEICDGADDDCDGRVDELLGLGEACQTLRPGPCQSGRTACIDGGWLCVHDGPEQVEQCNRIDDDCDGRTDEAPDRPICPQFESNLGSGERGCVDGLCVIVRCNPFSVDRDESYATGCECRMRHGGRELCDGYDDDCDDVIDEDPEQIAPAADRHQGVCAGLRRVCSNGEWTEPSYPDLVPDYEANEVRCDALDNDCDGRVDEGLIACDADCDGIDEDGDGRVDEAAPCDTIVCAANTVGPPCNGCPAGTRIPDGRMSGRWICVPEGRAVIGSPGDEPGRDADEAEVEVVIGAPFLMQAHPVTRAQWREALGGWPGQVLGGPCADDDDGRCPVSRVTWFDALAYMHRVSSQEQLDDCYAPPPCGPLVAIGRDCDVPSRLLPGCVGLRLPTEAEWAYAARAGLIEPWWGEPPAAVGWFAGNAGGRVHPVCGLLPGPWGLCDVFGNVAEWTGSRYGPAPDPWVPAAGLPPLMEQEADAPGAPEEMVVRGGGADADLAAIRPAERWPLAPGRLRDDVGFRPVIPLPGPP